MRGPTNRRRRKAYGEGEREGPAARVHDWLPRTVEPMSVLPRMVALLQPRPHTPAAGFQSAARLMETSAGLGETAKGGMMRRQMNCQIGFKLILPPARP